MHEQTAIVIGAGIVGLAMARSLGQRGVKVTVIERNERAVGASIRNFGMVWPVGQPNGKMYNRAVKTKQIWQQVCSEAGLWRDEVGSLHLAYTDLELQVMEEFVTANKGLRPVGMLTAAEAAAKSPAVNTSGLKGALWSGDEMIIESRVAIEKLPAYLTSKYHTQFIFNAAATAIEGNTVLAGGKKYTADNIYICSGADFETLYPEVFAANYFTKCKLQMMRLVAQPDSWRIGPSLCGGLSMIHYKAFEVAPALAELRKQYEATMPDYLKWGIHVMVSQNGEGELTIGDTHEYGLVHDPFDKQWMNQLVLDYLKTFAQFKNWDLIQSWNGIYPKRTNGETDFIETVAPGVTIVNGLGGAGMTLSFGLAEEVLDCE
ncbi:TIGR03364 family FAD-dependent oxidoreductase [Deminuibacter soli]|uniref:TIGR03364 family FAD-dependent oxidoreductase n=1 Tax=Deminuibacter soli TaxID=2291815 RepID=A0A3E1NDT9_9BACT|nr:TIGR03364 family FAD-dependent oxidoreductase [Deminuibacter soli]RFM26032.1 TIGR03364 family FAD-dependent oxidoreductase [Deminuibacter soli]